MCTLVWSVLVCDFSFAWRCAVTGISTFSRGQLVPFGCVRGSPTAWLHSSNSFFFLRTVCLYFSLFSVYILPTVCLSRLSTVRLYSTRRRSSFKIPTVILLSSVFILPTVILLTVCLHSSDRHSFDCMSPLFRPSILNLLTVILLTVCLHSSDRLLVVRSSIFILLIVLFSLY